MQNTCDKVCLQIVNFKRLHRFKLELNLLEVDPNLWITLIRSLSIHYLSWQTDETSFGILRSKLNFGVNDGNRWLGKIIGCLVWTYEQHTGTLVPSSIHTQTKLYTDTHTRTHTRARVYTQTGRCLPQTLAIPTFSDSAGSKTASKHEKNRLAQTRTQTNKHAHAHAHTNQCVLESVNLDHFRTGKTKLDNKQP